MLQTSLLLMKSLNNIETPIFFIICDVFLVSKCNLLDFNYKCLFLVVAKKEEFDDIGIVNHMEMYPFLLRGTDTLVEEPPPPLLHPLPPPPPPQHTHTYTLPDLLFPLLKKGSTLERKNLERILAHQSRQLLRREFVNRIANRRSQKIHKKRQNMGNHSLQALKFVFNPCHAE